MCFFMAVTRFFSRQSADHLRFFGHENREKQGRYSFFGIFSGTSKTTGYNCTSEETGLAILHEFWPHDNTAKKEASFRSNLTIYTRID